MFSLPVISSWHCSSLPLLCLFSHQGCLSFCHHLQQVSSQLSPTHQEQRWIARHWNQMRCSLIYGSLACALSCLPFFSACRGTVHTANGSQPPSTPSVEPSEIFPVLTNELQPERWRTSYVSLVRAVVCLLLFHRGAVKVCLCRTGFCFQSSAYVKWTTNVQLSTAGLIAGIFNQSHWENSILLK